MAVLPSVRERTSAATASTSGISSAMTSSTRSMSERSPKYWAILRSDLAVEAAPMKFTLIHGMPYLVSSMSAT